MFITFSICIPSYVKPFTYTGTLVVGPIPYYVKERDLTRGKVSQENMRC